MATSSREPSGRVIALPLPKLNPNSPQALIVLAQRRTAWNQAHPNATAEEQLQAGAEIAKELGL